MIDILPIVAFALAALGVMGTILIRLNDRERHRRSQMTDEQRKLDDEDNARKMRIW